jgi:hypothetical protein
MSGSCSTHGNMRNTLKNLVRKSELKNHSEDLDVDARIMLEWFL